MSRGLLLLTTLPIVIGLSAVDYNAELLAKDLSVQVLPIKELWQPPARISAQDLFHGPWSDGDAPDPAATYRFERSKRHGVNPGMTVVDPLGREWSVKQAPHDSRGAEGPIEVVLSRVLSAVGYHQPPVYYLPAFTLADTFGIRQEAGGRFRLKHPDLKERTTWAWGENPFAGMRPHQGLLVILIMFNSADLKNSNNSVYEHKTASGMEEWYVVRDLGAALGGTIGLRPRRGDPDEFGRQRWTRHVWIRRLAFQSRARPHHAGGRAVGMCAARAADRAAVVRRLPRRRLREAARRTVHQDAASEDC